MFSTARDIRISRDTRLTRLGHDYMKRRRFGKAEIASCVTGDMGCLYMGCRWG